MVSAACWAETMFGGLAPSLGTKRKETIYTNARVEMCTSVKERDSWSFYRTIPDGLTRDSLVFANGQTIHLTEVVVTESLPAKTGGRWRLLLPSTNHEELDDREVDQSKRNPLSAPRVTFGDSSVLRTSHTQDGPSDTHCRVVLLPLLLFHVLCNRALC